MDAWITSAVEDKGVDKAILLAGSLRRVFTAKKLVVVTDFSVPQVLRTQLKLSFDLVILLENEVPPNGLSLEDHAKLEALSLLAFNKCVYLSPNTVVLRNCDEIFEKYDKFAAWENGSGLLDSSVFLFTPSLEYSQALGGIIHDKGSENGGEGGRCFPSSFTLWVQNHIPNWEKLDEQYNAVFNLREGGYGRSLGAKVAITNFVDAHPLDVYLEGDFGDQQELGHIEKLAVNLCGKIYAEDVRAQPNIRQDDPIKLAMYKNEPIAIVGMSFRLPGGNSVDEFWDLLSNGKDAIKLLPDTRWQREHTHIPCMDRDVEAGFLSIPLDEFDSKFFGISGKEAEFLDPQQRLLHEIAWEALEDAMIEPHSLRGSQTGIFVGSWLQDYKDMVSQTTDAKVDFFRVYMGNSIAGGAARLSHFLETTGPSIATESGCSSSIVAVDMAVKSLRNRCSNLALACGVNLLLHPFDRNSLPFVVSPDGHCKTFDEKANGFGRAEGCGVLVMKRLSDATRDGNKIWGMIRGSAITQEGLSKSLGTPTIHSESLAMELALKDASVDPTEVSYVEAHGTGTFVGDPLEIASITKAYSKRRSEPLVIGSVKTNVGHTESASGITGIIKVLLSMKNEKIPKHLNLNVLNPAINLDAIPAIIPLDTMSWPKLHDKPRIAGVSSFGISGTDGHVIIQEPPTAPSHLQPLAVTEVEPRPLHIFKMSAKSPESFQSLLTSYEAILEDLKDIEGDSFANLAYSANIGRQTFNHRAVIIANNCRQALDILKEKRFKQTEVSSTGSQLCFLFTGQGSQYPKMAHNLYKTSTIFRNYFDKCDQLLTKRYGINLHGVLWGKSVNDTDLSRTLYSQTSIFCIEYCLLKLWESWGVKPDYVMGHSLGEFAAAVAVGALNFENALMLVAERSRFIDSLPGGKMLVIKADKMTVDQEIEKFKQVSMPDFWVDYAALNSPDQTVVAGDSEIIEEFGKFCGENSKMKTIILAATHAFHSRHMEPILDAYRRVAQVVKPPRRVDEDAPKYISGMEGKLIDLEKIDADYWVRHTREPVRFMDACKVIQSEGCSLFLELGPHPVLSALTMMNIEGQSVTCLPSLRKKEDEWVTMLNSLSKLYLSDWKGQIDWNGFDLYHNRSKVPLPFYPFNRKPVWKKLEGVLPPLHPLLGQLIPTAANDTIVYESRLTLRNTPFILDHVIGNTVIFPGAAFLEMCLAGGHATVQPPICDLKKPPRPVTIKSLMISSPLALYKSEVCRLQTVTRLDDANPDEMGYSVGVHRFLPGTTSAGGGSWIPHASAKFLPGGPPQHSQVIPINIPNIQAKWEESTTKAFYEDLPEIGLRFGNKFQSLQTIWKSGEGMLASVKVPEEALDPHLNYIIHPVIADAMIQATMMWISEWKHYKDQTGKNKMKLQVPVQIGEFVWLQASSSPTRYIHCSTNEGGKISCILLDDQGSELALMRGVDFIETSVKLVEVMIQQQETVMPKLWVETWRNAPGALQSAYDLTGTGDLQLLQFNEQQRQTLARANDVGEDERHFYSEICDLTRLFFLNAMYELGWEPKEGNPFTLEELMRTLLPNSKPHFKKFVGFFLRSIAETGMLVADPSVENKYHFKGLPPTPDEIRNSLGRTVDQPKNSSRVEHKMMIQAGCHLSKLLLGEVDPLPFLFPDDPSKPNASQFYAVASSWTHPLVKPVNEALTSPIISHVYNSYMKETKTRSGTTPVWRVLEVGAGTGGFTQPYLDYLEGLGHPFEYCFTDVSASFFSAAEKKFEKHSKHLIFKKFNMEEDPLVQGFCPKYFDIILAAEVLHVAKDMRKTMRNLQCLLKPGGIFQIIETTLPDPRITMFFGLLEGYWQFEDLELRPYHATMSPKKWEQVLREIGCDKVACLPVYNNVHSFIAARLSPGVNDTALAPLGIPQQSWIIFHHEESAKLADLLAEKLIKVNRKVHLVKRPSICEEHNIKDLMKSSFSLALKEVRRVEGVIYLWGLPGNVQDDVRDQARVSLPLVSLLQELKELKELPRIYVVTQGIAPVDGSEVLNPTGGTLHGMVKSLVNENAALQLNILDLSPNTSDQANDIFHELWGMDPNNKLIAIRDNRRLCVKLISAKVSNHEPLSLPSGTDRFQLVLAKSQMISDLEYGVLESYSLKETEVEVKVKAVALNFRDLFTVMKPSALPEFKDFHSVGIDFSGVVTKIGSGVTKRKVGDRVFFMNMSKNLAMPSHAKVEEQYMFRLPDYMTFVEGATLPLAFSTAFYCLIKVAQMKRGDTVLIHTASGGVGLFAIQLAKRVGAEIIATAGSSAKQNYLRNLGIKHIFHSRKTDFGQQILEVTNGRGVDIVLNSLTGEGFKEASLKALSKNGRFIEMSKLNVWKPDEVKGIRPDAFYQIVDLSAFDNGQIQELMEQLNQFLQGHHLEPIAYERFDAVNIRGALNYLQHAKHIGKIVCVMPEVKVENSKITSTTPLFNDLSTYLVTGGLGGIGLEVVKWMLNSGANHIAIASRSPPKPEIASQIESWNKSGKHVEAFSVDIGDFTQCQQLFQELSSPERGFPQLRGVMHAAGVLSDAILENQTWAKFNHTYNPKVRGTWNLHDLTKDLLLEHFVLFSSMAASIGSPGQSNHAASTRFEDTLAAYRRSNGLPATTVNWGNWGEVGVATELDFPGIRPISTSQGILALETFLKTQTTQMNVINVDSFSLAVSLFPNLKHYVDDKRLFGDLKATTIISSDEFWKQVDSAEDREGKLEIFKTFIKSTLKNLLKMDRDEVIDDMAEFQTLGMDSLMMLELKNGLQNILGARMTINSNQLKDCSNTEALANRFVDVLLEI